MDEKLLYRCWTKGLEYEEGAPRRSLRWIAAKRAWFRLYEDRIECGSWVLLNSSIEEAVVVKTRQGLTPVTVLLLRTSRGTYQFGFNPWCRVEAHLPFEFRVEQVSLRHSRSSMVLHLAVVAVLVYWLVRRLL